MSTKRADEDRVKLSLEKLRSRLMQAREGAVRSDAIASRVDSGMNVTATRKLHRVVRGN